MPNQQSFKCNPIELIPNLQPNKFKKMNIINNKQKQLSLQKIKSEEIGTKWTFA
jgi:hypothetical protein